MTLADLASLIDDLEWRKDAACRDLPAEYFFWGDGTQGGGTPDAVKTVTFNTCRCCTVRQACLDYAMETFQPAGVWGGLTPQQRRALRKRRVA